MKVKLLGTGAADGIPALFSDSRVTRFAREKGGKEIRTRTAALIDGHLKIDFGPDTFGQSSRDRLDPRDWSAVIFTHSDADHFAVKELQYCLFPFTADFFPTFTIFANDPVCDEIEYHYPEWPFELHRTRSFCTFEHAGYRITPVRAYHSRGEDCQNLLIQDGEVNFLYATDTGIWQPPTWEFLEDVRLDALVLECTNGKERSNYWGHLNVEECTDVVRRLREMGTLKPGAPVLTTHHSHEGDLTHCELEEALAPFAITAGFDGIELEITSL